MRKGVFGSVLAMALLTAFTGPGSATAASGTERIVVRPATSAGVPATGFRVITDDRRADAVDCSSPAPSTGAVSPDIERCFPSAAYAIACWKAAAAHRVLCSRDPRSKSVYSLPRSGKFASTARVDRRDRAPLVLVLADGTVCSIRDGGAWGQLKSQPDWYGTYSCDHHGDVWSPPNAPHNGVNESRPAWTVHTSPASGNGPITVRTVRKAYFVGTHS